MLRKIRCFKSLAFMIAIVLAFMSVAPMRALADTPQSGSSVETPDIEDALELYDTVVTVQEDTIADVVSEYDVPDEVVAYMDDVFTRSPGATVTAYIPDDEPGVTTRGTSTSWGPVLNYKGYTLQEYILKVDTSFPQTLLYVGSLAQDFCETLIVFCGGALLDRIVPFGSAAVTLIDFVGTHGKQVRTSAGDKVSVAPQYTAYTTFTYVGTGNERLLGARTSVATLFEARWWYYSERERDWFDEVEVYNQYYKSPGTDNRNELAITSYGNGGYLDEPICVDIGGKEFVLE